MKLREITESTSSTAPILHLAVAVGAVGLAWPVWRMFDAFLIILSGLLGWILSGDRIPWKLEAFSRAAAALIIVAGSMAAADQFPGRRIAVFLMCPYITYWLGRSFRERHPAQGYLFACIGLSTAPFTELNLDRDIFTTVLAGFMFFEIIRSTPTVENDSSRIHIFGTEDARPLLFFLIFIFIMAAGIPLSVYPYISFKYCFIFLFYLLVMAGCLILFRDAGRRKSAAHFILGLSSLYLMFAYSSALNRIWHMGIRSGLQFRIFIFERHPNYTIFPVLMTLPVWLALILKPGLVKSRHMGWAGFSFSVIYLLVWAYSRSSWIILGLFLVLTGYFYIPRLGKNRKLYIITGLMIVICIFGFLFNSQATRFLTIFNTEQNSRMTAWPAFIELIRFRPWTGYGMGTNRFIFPQGLATTLPAVSPTRQFLVEAHNAYIDIAAGSGLPALAAFILFLWSITKPLARVDTADHFVHKAIGLAVWIDLVFNFRFHAHDLGILLVFYLSYAFSNRYRENRACIRFRPFILKTAAFLVLIVSILPYSAKLCTNHALKLLPTGRWAEIERFYRLASILEPLNAHPHFYLSMVYKQIRDASLTLDELNRAVQLNPNFAFYRYQCAVENLAQGRSDEAAKQAVIARKLEPYDPEGQYRFLAGLLNPEGLYSPDSLADLWTAVLLNPEILNDPFWNQNPRLKQTMGRNFLDFFFYTNLNPAKNYYPLHYAFNFTRIFEKLQMRPLIDTAYRNTRPINQAVEPYVVAMALYFKRQGEVREAENMLNETLRTGLRFPSCLNILASIDMERGDYGKARILLQESIRKWTHLSLDNLDAYQMLHDCEKHLKNEREVQKIARILQYLSGPKIESQRADLAIHGGSNITELFVMDALKLSGPDSEPE